MLPRIDGSTKVIVLGITGRAGRQHRKIMREYGTNIFGGVSPKSEVKDVDGVPVFADSASAVRATGAVACVAMVGAMQLLAAIKDAVAAGIKLLVTPTEGMPVHDAVEALECVRAAGVMWIGASTPGMAGPLGLMSKSGTLSYETGYRLAQAGIGQSVWVGVGGDPVKGTRYAELVPFYKQDERTRGLLVIGEIGAHEEEDFAQALIAQKFDKPVFALIAGRSAPEGMTMGHAGALVHGSHGSFEAKRAALQAAGVTVFASLGELVAGVKAKL